MTTNYSNPVAAFIAVSDAVIAQQELLCELDAHQGDGDHGISMTKTFKAVKAGLEAQPQLGAPEVLKLVGMTVLTEVGGAMGPLFGSAFLDSSKALDSDCSPESVAAAIRAGSNAIAKRGGAQVGDKTMVDATSPAADDAEANTNSLSGVLTAAAEGARRGVDSTVDMIAKRGRAARVGERSRGAADAGATSVFIILSTLAEFYRGVED